MGPRVSAVMPATGASMANLAQMVREMLSERVAVIPAATQAA